MSVLQGALEIAINQRGRPYQQMFAVSVRFEVSGTSADKDQLPLLFDHPQSLVIEADDVHPGWTEPTVPCSAVQM